jgi:erythromycin esterase
MAPVGLEISISNPSNKPLHEESAVRYSTLQQWVQQEAHSFLLDDSESFKGAVDRLLASCGDRMQLLGLGEPLHGGEAFLLLRNHLFQYIAESHGFSAIAVESSFSKSRIVNDYITGRGAETYESIAHTGFSHGFGAFEANLELVEWMRAYNADPAHATPLHFYGFDSPTEMYGTDSPHDVLNFVLDYLTSVDKPLGEQYRQRMEPLLGNATAWENPEALMDPTKGIGLTASATQLRVETEELITELNIRRSEGIAKSGKSRYLEALQFASVARQLLTYHATLARSSDDRFDRLMGIRDAMMADMLVNIVARERDRGKVLVFAHNSHLKRGISTWQLGAELHKWDPAGVHISAMFGENYVVIGTALGVSEANGVGTPEAGTLEAILMEHSGPARFVQTRSGTRLPPSLIAELPTRTASQKNGSYFPLTAQSFTDFDWLCFLDSTTYSRGAPPLPA